jgi:hypothetical protein
VLRHEVARRAAKPLPAFLALRTSPAAGPCDRTAQCPDDLVAAVAAVADPELLVSAMRATSQRWKEADHWLFRAVRPALSAVLEGLRTAGLADWRAEHVEADLRSTANGFANQTGRNSGDDARHRRSLSKAMPGQRNAPECRTGSAKIMVPAQSPRSRNYSMTPIAP